MDRYTSPEFFVARAETWRIMQRWPTNKEQYVSPFLRRTADQVPDMEQPSRNGLTLHQNLSWLLHFYATLALYEEAKLVDRRMIKTLFGAHYQWFAEFFEQFCEEFNRQAEPTAQRLAWLVAFPRLRTLFQTTP
jgi:hypothetical protein